MKCTRDRYLAQVDQGGVLEWVIHGRYTSLGRKGEAAKDMPSWRMDIDDVAEATSR